MTYESFSDMRSPSLGAPAMELRADSMQLVAEPELKLRTWRSLGAGVALQQRSIESESYAMRPLRIWQRSEGERHYGELERVLKEGANPAISDYEELYQVDTSGLAIIKNRGTGETRRLDLLKDCIHPAGQPRNLALAEHYEGVVRWISSEMGLSHVSPPVYVPGDRGNPSEGAPAAFSTYSHWKIPKDRDGALLAHLDDVSRREEGRLRGTILRRAALSPAEEERQRAAVLELGAGSMAFFDVYMYGLNKEIERTKGELERKRAAIRSTQTSGAQVNPQLIAERQQNEKDLARLQLMRRQIEEMSHFSMFSAERERPKGTGVSEAQYDVAMARARSTSHRLTHSPMDAAHRFSLGTSMLLAAQKGRHIPGHDGATRLDIAQVYSQEQQVVPEDIERPTLRFYDLYCEGASAASDLFHSSMYEGIDRALEQRLKGYEGEGRVAMQAARVAFNADPKKVEPSALRRLKRNSARVGWLHSVVVDPVFEERKQAVDGIFAGGAPSGGAAAAPVPGGGAPGSLPGGGGPPRTRGTRAGGESLSSPPPEERILLGGMPDPAEAATPDTLGMDEWGDATTLPLGGGAEAGTLAVPGDYGGVD